MPVAERTQTTDKLVVLDTTTKKRAKEKGPSIAARRFTRMSCQFAQSYWGAAFSIHSSTH